MPERRRTLLDTALDERSVLGGFLQDVRKAARHRVLENVLDETIRPRVDQVLDRVRKR